ncbi:MAG: PQQ-binding-like beta-propeller repeat protein [Planctomycetota bacterium]
MPHKSKVRSCAWWAPVFPLLIALPALGGDAGPSLPNLLERAGVHGGLVVCVGSDSPDLIASPRPNESYVVQGLCANSERIPEARQVLRDKGVYGPVSLRHWREASLPYTDDLVNALVIINPGREVAAKEVRRVLAPGGTVIGPRGCRSVPNPSCRVGEGYVAFTEPVSAAIDEWTHALHGPDNNALAEDTVVGPPRHMQWRGEPTWGRHHHAEKGTNPTVRTVVSAGGRLFYLFDQTETSNMRVPAQWTLAARDAFSGTLLWKKRVDTEKYRKRLELVWRQLVTDGGRVYTAFGKDRMLKALNAADGKVIRSYEGTSGLEEVIIAGECLFVLLENDEVVAIEADTGTQLWRWDSSDEGGVIPLTLAAANGNVFAKTEKSLCCLSAQTGTLLWRTSLPGPEKKVKLGFPREKLLVKDGVVLCSYGGEDPRSLNRDIHEYLGSHPRVHEYGGKLGAFSTNDGSQLWETDYYPNLESAPGEIYIHDGLVWLGPDFAEPRDLRGGEVKKKRPVIERLWTDGHHYRCYPGKATSKYIITAKRGIEMIDITGSNHSRNNWVRGTCRVGITPCNGLIYAPPHSCGCYIEAKLFGFWALASDRQQAGLQAGKDMEKLEKGPAYAEIGQTKPAVPDSAWWTYRGGIERGGSTSAKIAADVKVSWKTELGGKLSAVSAAGGKVYAAQVDAHTVHSLDMATGRTLWSFTAGGRVDSPPTVVEGLVLFGSRDGYVYCLRESDGRMVWRYRAAPGSLQAMALNQPESLWPVHGSVLYVSLGKASPVGSAKVETTSAQPLSNRNSLDAGGVRRRGVVYAAAGRSSYLDGGIRLVGLDPVSGQVVSEKLIKSEHPGALDPPENAEEMSRKNRQNWMDYKTELAPDKSDSFAMRGARPEILVGDDHSIYMHHKRFDFELAEQKGPRSHLFATSNLLDGWEHNRNYWILGTGNFYNTPVAYPWIIRRAIQVPCGLMLSFNRKTVWGVRRGGQKNTVFAAPRPDPMDKQSSLPDFAARESARQDGGGWTTDLSIRPRSMVRAGDLLFVGGMPIDQLGDPYSLASRDGENEKRGRLHVLSCDDGRTIRRLQMASPPVWDGMAAVQGRLFIPRVDGSVVCLSNTVN